MHRSLVTGGAGFIGSHLVRALVRDGVRVCVLDNFATGSRENLADLLDRVELREGDVRDREAVRDAARGVDTIFHEAALASVPRSVQDPETTHDVNVTGTLNVLLAARLERVRRVVAASSSSVYGDAPGMPRREDQRLQPISPYAAQKAASEQYCRAFSAAYGIETVCLRFFNVFGPNQDPGSPYAAVVPRFICSLLRGEPPVIYGDGSQTRDFTYVENVVRANLLAASSARAAGEVFNVSAGQRTTVLDLLQTIASHFERPPAPRHEPPRPGDILHSEGDISRAREMLGYAPLVSFAEGIALTVAWQRERARAVPA